MRSRVPAVSGPMNLGNVSQSLGVRMQLAELLLGGMMPLSSERILQEQSPLTAMIGNPVATVSSGVGGDGPAVTGGGTPSGAIHGNSHVDLGKFLGFPSLGAPVPILGNVNDSV
ncbi:hypothetical protein NE237_010384 [Protea cynaroides]|uniref:Uncharacterized protein n=1 Tax=Protea cynaroides TaxID=273540 RepID=A0A9Q0R1I8_9MAGN|nr:hypothetical protein NE237_010384 [Protea cynaroides]